MRPPTKSLLPMDTATGALPSSTLTPAFSSECGAHSETSLRTVRKASVNDRAPYTVIDIASYRQVFDVGNWDRSLVVNTTGQSGHPRSPHYFDQNALWASGQYRTMPFTRAAVEKARTNRLLLTP